MRESHLVRVLIWREIYSRRKAFIVTTVLVLGLVVGGLAIAGLASSDDGPPTITVGVVEGDGAELEEALASRLDPETLVEVGSYQRLPGEDALRSGDLNALVVGYHDVLWGPSTQSWIMEAVTSAMFTINLEHSAADLNLSEADVSKMLAPISGETIDYEEADEATMAIAVITVILMFVGILAYGQWIAYGVVEEKANRVAELILGAVTPGQLLTAKMISLGGLGLAQLVLVAGSGLIAANLFFDFELPPVTGAATAWLIFWFIVGFSFYGSLYAASGSLAADTQEAGSFIGPLNILPGVGYMLGVIALSSGSDTLARIMSLIPLWSPMLMPGRMANGTATGWDVAVAIALTLVFTVAVVRISARVYLGGITQASRRVNWRQAFRGGEDLSGA